MPSKKERNESSNNSSHVNASVDDLLVAALERGGDSQQTGRYLITLKEGATQEGIQQLSSLGMRIADARDFTDQAITMEEVDADSIHLPEIGVVLVSGQVAQERSLDVQTELASDSPIESIDPEYFVFANQTTNPFLSNPGQLSEEAPDEYMRGFLRAAEIIAKDLHPDNGHSLLGIQEEIEVLGATWGLNAC